MSKGRLLLIPLSLLLAAVLIWAGVVWAQGDRQHKFPFQEKGEDYIGWAVSEQASPAPTPVIRVSSPLQEGSPERGATFPFEGAQKDYKGWVFTRVISKTGLKSSSYGFEARGGLAWTPLRMDAIAETRIVYYTGSPCSAMVAFARVHDFRRDGHFVGSTAWATEDYCGDDKTANAKTSVYGWVYGHSWSMKGHHKAEENGQRVWGIVETSVSKDL